MMRLRSAAFYLWPACLVALACWPISSAFAQAPLSQGFVDYEVSYEDVGPMAAMLPKNERVYFRPGQVRIESGMNTTLRGVVPGHQVQLMDLEGHRVAFVMPSGDEADEHELLRFEAQKERRKIAGFEAFQVDGVDREDETNRLPYWLTDQISAEWRVSAGLPSGFPLEYTVIFQEGLSHRIATHVEAQSLTDAQFSIPEGYRRIDIDSPQDIGRHLGEILGGNVQVLE